MQLKGKRSEEVTGMNYMIYIMKEAPREATKNLFLMVFSGLGQRNGTTSYKKSAILGHG